MTRKAIIAVLLFLGSVGVYELGYLHGKEHGEARLWWREVERQR